MLGSKRDRSTPTYRPEHISLSRTSTPTPYSPDPSHAVPLSVATPLKPLLQARSNSAASLLPTSLSPNPSSAGPSRSTSYDHSSVLLEAPSYAPNSSSTVRHVRDRYSGCKLCGLVKEVQAIKLVELSDAADLSEERSTNTRPDVGPSRYVDHGNGPHTGENGWSFPTNGSKGTSNDGPYRRMTAQSRDVLYHDKDITIYPAEGKEKLCSDGKHLVVVLNQHVESVYEFGPTDIPLLSKIISVSRELLVPGQEMGQMDTNYLRIGFLGTIMKDPQLPYAHLHAHAMLGPVDPSLPGATFWRRNVVYGWGNWWSIEDLRAEIRESTSNNRTKSGYESRKAAPIDRVPGAGSTSGLPNALDSTPRRYQENGNPGAESSYPSEFDPRSVRGIEV